MTEVYNPGGGGGYTFVDTNVVDGALTALSWINLDLSSIIGSTTRIVMLRVNNSTGSTAYIKFRTDGDGITPYYGGLGSVNLLNNNGGYILLKTSSAGIIEYYAQVTGPTWTFDVIGYI